VALFASTLVVAAPAQEAVQVVKRGGSSPSYNDPKFINACLKEHHRHRKVHQAADLTWDNDLAASAQNVANTCQMVHSDGQYGENLAMCWPAPDNYYSESRKLIDDWAQEIKLVTWGNIGFDERYGHATAMNWVSTKKVGCAIQNCGDNAMLVCHYGDSIPNMAGEYNQNVKPFKRPGRY